MSGERDDTDKRILACTQRAPGGSYTAVQLARSTGLSVSQVQQSLADLQQAGALLPAPLLPYPAYCLAHQQPAPAGRFTSRERADRDRSQPAA
jgi:hypothetical protein